MWINRKSTYFLMPPSDVMVLCLECDVVQVSTVRPATTPSCGNPGRLSPGRTLKGVGTAPISELAETVCRMGLQQCAWQ